MSMCTLTVGDELVLDGGVRVTVLVVEGETVLLAIAGHGDARAVAPEAPEGRTPARGVLSACPSAN
jgi:hypothetical protein